MSIGILQVLKVLVIIYKYRRQGKAKTHLHSNFMRSIIMIQKVPRDKKLIKVIFYLQSLDSIRMTRESKGL